jgi:hypothetical protein
VAGATIARRSSGRHYDPSVSARDREWLLTHLRDQIEHLSALAHSAGARAGDDVDLVALRDQIFVIRETLDTVAVPAARPAAATDALCVGLRAPTVRGPRADLRGRRR